MSATETVPAQAPFSSERSLWNVTGGQAFTTKPCTFVLGDQHFDFRAPEPGGQASLHLLSNESTNSQTSSNSGFDREVHHPIFRDVTFPALDFKKARFPKGASFVHCRFEGDVIFQEAVFAGPCYFWNCRFFRLFSFLKARVLKDHPAVKDREQGELNSYTRFEFAVPGFTQPSFDRAVIEGQSYFHRTVFRMGVKADECRFQGGVRFESLESDICMHEQDLRKLLPKELFEAFQEIEPRVFSRSTDQDSHYDFDSNIRSVESLNRALVRSLKKWRTQPLTSEEKSARTQLALTTKLLEYIDSKRGSQNDLPGVGWYRWLQRAARVEKDIFDLPNEAPEAFTNDIVFVKKMCLLTLRSCAKLGKLISLPKCLAASMPPSVNSSVPSGEPPSVRNLISATSHWQMYVCRE